MSDDDDLKFRHPFSCAVSGPSKSGKTSFCIRLLQKLAALSTEREFGGGIIWCYSEKTAVPKRRLLPQNTTYHEGIPENFVGGGRPRLVILDDLLNDVYSKQVCDMFTRGSHHRNIRLILITQNLFHQGRYCRDISLNAYYVVALKNVRDKKLFMYLANQVYPEYNIGLYNAYLDATQRPHGYLILDLTQDTNDGLRFRTNIFPEEYHPVVYSDVGDEACEVELPRSSRDQDS